MPNDDFQLRSYVDPTSAVLSEFLRVKDLNPQIKCSNIKVLVLEISPPFKEDTITLLVADESGCVNVIVKASQVASLHSGDIIRILGIRCVLDSSRMSVVLGTNGRVERIGEFTMIFKEQPNMSRINWVKDTTNSDIWVPANTQRSIK